ncbi:hypothetical protein DSECCO2_651780 [anaerobic digester metagenome]
MHADLFQSGTLAIFAPAAGYGKRKMCFGEFVFFGCSSRCKQIAQYIGQSGVGGRIASWTASEGIGIDVNDFAESGIIGLIVNNTQQTRFAASRHAAKHIESAAYKRSGNIFQIVFFRMNYFKGRMDRLFCL